MHARVLAESKGSTVHSRARMFEYFPRNYPWNMSVLMTLHVGGEISEIDEACRRLVQEAKNLSP
jgi:hypothetical protein